MEEHTPAMSQEDIQIYVRVSEVVTKKFANKLYEPTIIEDVLSELHQFERTKVAEEAVRHVVFNRQLMKERFL